MKKVLKFITFILLAIVSIFTVASCSEEPSTSEPSKESSESSSSSSSVGSESSSSSSSSSSTLTEAEIKASFDTKVKGVTLSKAVINSAIDKVVDKVLEENTIDLDTINLPNSKASVTMYGNETTTTDEYLWQNERVVYTTYADQVYKVDLDDVKTILGALTTQASETTDYVGLVLNYVKLPEGFDLDAALAKIKLTGEDFTYDSTTSYFTLKTDAIYRIASEVSGIEQSAIQSAVATYVSDLVVKVGYDGVHFTGLVFEARPSAVLCTQGFDATKSYLTLNVGLTYSGDKVSTATVAFNYVFTPLATSNIEKQEISLNATYDGTTLSGTAKVYYGMLDLRMRVEMDSTFTLTKTGANVTVSGTYKDVRGEVNPETNAVTYSYGAAQTISATLNVTGSSLTASAKINDKEVVKVEGTITNNEVTTLTVTLKHTDETNSTFATVVLTTENVTIPDTVKAKEADATDLVEMIKGLIGGGSQDTPGTTEDTK